MTLWFYLDAAIFLVVVAITGFIIPQILMIAFRKNLFDEVDPRKIHKGTVPRLGGIAFFPAILFSMMLVIGVSRLYFGNYISSELEVSLTEFCFIACAIVILYLVGMADDLIGLRYRAKFIAQIIAAILIIIPGIQLSNMHGFLMLGQLPYTVSVVFTVILIVFIINAINLIDGIDGLASGLSAIACAFYGFIFICAGLHLMGMLSFATLGALIPFFYYNVFGNAHKHSKIFMGDTGALTIGLILSIFSITICGIDDEVLSLNPGVVAFAPLLIPCLDVVRVYLQRLRSHRNPFMPDKTHIHHKLLALGMSQRVAMPTILASSLLLSLANYLLSPYINITILFILDLLVWTLANIALSRAINRQANVVD